MSDDYLNFLSHKIFPSLNDKEKLQLNNCLNDKTGLGLKIDNETDSLTCLLINCSKLKELKLIENDINNDLIPESCLDIVRPDLLNLLSEYYKNNKEHTVTILNQSVKLKFKPYKFQISLCNYSCLGHNNIICVQTGSGKTLISALIAKYWFTKLQPNSDKFKICFIVPTRNLVTQQYNAFKLAFDSEDLIEIGEKYNPEKINLFFKHKKIIFLTPQKLINTLNSTNLSLSDIGIIFFDECHHTNENHPYNEIMKLYNKDLNENKKVPQIVGLTASLGTGKLNSALDHLIKLCANLNCKKISFVSSAQDLEDLNSNIPSPLNDEIISVPNGVYLNDLIKHVYLTIDQIHNYFKLPIYSFSPASSEYEQFLFDLERDATIKHQRDLISGSKFLKELNLFYARILDFPMNYCLIKLNDFIEEINQKEQSKVENLLKSFVDKLIDHLNKNKQMLGTNPKLETLISTILKLHQNDSSRGLILVKTRNHTKALKEFLNEDSRLRSRSIKSNTLVGQGTIDDISMNENQQIQVINNFKEGIFNLLVATDIAQEGLDVPTCNYVIRYEFVSNEIGTVQSRGRARANKGQTVLITSENSLNEKREYENRAKESEMKTALKEYDKLSQIEFENRFNKIRDEINLVYQMNEFFINSNSNFSNASNLLDSSLVNVHCRECNKFLFNAKNLKYREPSYISVCNEFIKNHILVISETKKFTCSDQTCKKELGRLIEMRNSRPFHMIDIKGVKFKFLKNNKIEVYSQWSKVKSIIDIQNI